MNAANVGFLTVNVHFLDSNVGLSSSTLSFPTSESFSSTPKPANPSRCSLFELARRSAQPGSRFERLDSRLGDFEVVFSNIMLGVANMVLQSRPLTVQWLDSFLREGLHSLEIFVSRRGNPA